MSEERVHAHIVRPVEQPFLRRLSDWSHVVESRGRLVLTDFLTPREQILLVRHASQHAIHHRLHGGLPTNERRRAILLPDDWPLEPSAFAIVVLEVRTSPLDPLTHGSVLGSLLGTGIERRKLGDLGLTDGTVRVLVCADIVPFLLANWTAIGRRTIAPAPLPTIDIPAWDEPLYERDVVDVTSLRADTVIAHACHLSRSKVQEALTKKQVTLNFAEFTDADTPVADGDILSIRGYGRVRIYTVIGETKSGRFRLEVGRLKSNQR